MVWDNGKAFRDCPWCGLTNTRLNVLSASMQVRNKFGESKFWTLLACPACANAVAMQHGGPETTDRGIYAVVPKGTLGEAEIKHLPQDVEQYYSDALRVLRVGVPDAAAVQLRRTLEAAAAHYDIKERVLVRSIEKLMDEGHVTQSFAPVLHHIRVVGNVGAHAGDERVDQATAERALRFTTQLLRNLFEVPGELRELQEEAGDDQPD